MPTFDFTCEACGAVVMDRLVSLALRDSQMCVCGVLLTRLPASPVVHDDSYIGGKVLKNVAHEDITVFSKTEERVILKQHGVEPMVRHVGEQGSDKSRHTTRWT